MFEVIVSDAAWVKTCFCYEQHDDFEAKCICKRYGRGRYSNSGAILCNIQDWLVLLFYLFFMGY